MNFLPLCTASVWPTNSGAIVDRRDHVLRTFFWRERLSSSIRPYSFSSMKGPFLVERPMPCSYFFRRVPIMESDGRAPRRVLYPFAGLPHGAIGGLPFPLPSPPPIGWSPGLTTLPPPLARTAFQRPS